MYAPKRVVTLAIASGASTSSWFDLGDMKYSKMAVNIPTMSTGYVVGVYGCATSAGTFLPVHERVNTAPVQYQALTIATSTSGAWAVLDCPPHQFLQFCTTATVDGGASVTVIFSQN